jgi:hypothetical protein
LKRINNNMAVNQTIQSFYRTAADRDFSRDFLFRVQSMNLPGAGSMPESELVYAKAANLPGRAITNVPVPYMGLNFNVPGNATYPGSEGYSLTFYLDAASRIRTYFETASRGLFDDSTSIGGYGTPDDDYFITLVQLNKSLDPIENGTFKLIGASVRNINDIAYSIASGTGQTVEVTATIAYHYYIDPRTA